MTTLVEHGTVSSRLESLSGDRAVLHLSYTLNHDQTLFFESGTIVFGSCPGASTLEFSSVGAGSLRGAPDADGFTRGVVAWKIDRGTVAKPPQPTPSVAKHLNETYPKAHLCSGTVVASAMQAPTRSDEHHVTAPDADRRKGSHRIVCGDLPGVRPADDFRHAVVAWAGDPRLSAVDRREGE